jgi:5-(carboxyamino)imidazole ribonucleotide mutase
MTEPKGRGPAWTEERGTSDEGRRGQESAPEASEGQSTSDEGRQRLEGPRRREVSRVGVVMGSDSDWPVMRAAAEVLAEFGVAYEADVVSAHRMPRDMIEYGSSAEGRGLRVIIAGAGGAAHLPGMLASVTTLPVIGVPVPLKNLSGLDSLLSIVQMPAGIPVATVAVGGARNAGLLAVRILGAADGPGGAALRAKLSSFAERLADQARAKGAALRESGAT